MEIEHILEGTNGILGKYSVNKVSFNSSSGELEVGVIYMPFALEQMVDIKINVTSSLMLEKEKRKEIYLKRKSIIKKLLE